VQCALPLQGYGDRLYCGGQTLTTPCTGEGEQHAGWGDAVTKVPDQDTGATRPAWQFQLRVGRDAYRDPRQSQPEVGGDVLIPGEQIRVGQSGLRERVRDRPMIDEWATPATGGWSVDVLHRLPDQRCGDEQPGQSEHEPG